MLRDLSKYENYIDLTACRIRYYELGSGTNHTILIHGRGTNADTFQFVLEDLAKDLKVYAIDCPGYGKSDRKLPYGPTFDIVIDSIREFIDVKGLAPANLIGHSAGGWYAAILAYQSPDRIRRLVTIGAAGMNEMPAGGVGSRVGIENEPFPEETIESWMRGLSTVLVEGSFMTPELAKEMAEQFVSYDKLPGAHEGLIPLVNQMGIPEMRRIYLTHRMLPFIKVPSMVMWGTGGGKPLSDKYPNAGRADTVEPYPTWTAQWDQIGGDVSKSSKPWVIPGARYVPLPTGHTPHWQQPQTFVKIVGEFLAE